MLLAAENVGRDGTGTGGLTGYLEMLAREDRKTFAGLLGRMVPLQVDAKLTGPAISKEQRDAAVAAFARADG